LSKSIWLQICIVEIQTSQRGNAQPWMLSKHQKSKTWYDHRIISSLVITLKLWLHESCILVLGDSLSPLHPSLHSLATACWAQCLSSCPLARPVGTGLCFVIWCDMMWCNVTFSMYSKHLKALTILAVLCLIDADSDTASWSRTMPQVPSPPGISCRTVYRGIPWRTPRSWCLQKKCKEPCCSIKR
jgi:hypothetical protein